MLLDASLQTHAWASARPFHETDMATRSFEQQILAFQAQENEQGMLQSRPPPSLFLFLFGFVFGRPLLPRPVPFLFFVLVFARPLDHAYLFRYPGCGSFESPLTLTQRKRAND